MKQKLNSRGQNVHKVKLIALTVTQQPRKLIFLNVSDYAKVPAHWLGRIRFSWELKAFLNKSILSLHATNLIAAKKEREKKDFA